MYGNAQSYTTPIGMVAESERKWAIAEAARQARLNARTEPTNEDWGDLVCAVEFSDSQEQAALSACYTSALIALTTVKPQAGSHETKPHVRYRG